MTAQADYDKWTAFNPSIEYATKRADGREEFFRDFSKLSNNEFWNKYKKIPVKKRAKYIAKRMLKLFNLDKIARKFA